MSPNVRLPSQCSLLLLAYFLQVLASSDFSEGFCKVLVARKANFYQFSCSQRITLCSHARNAKTIRYLSQWSLGYGMPIPLVVPPLHDLKINIISFGANNLIELGSCRWFMNPVHQLAIDICE